MSDVEDVLRSAQEQYTRYLRMAEAAAVDDQAGCGHGERGTRPRPEAERMS